MLLIGVFNLGGINDGVSGTEEGEEEREDDCDPDVCSQGDPDGVYLELEENESPRVSNNPCSLEEEKKKKRGGAKGELSQTADLKGFWMSFKNSSPGSSRRITDTKASGSSGIIASSTIVSSLYPLAFFCLQYKQHSCSSFYITPAEPLSTKLKEHGSGMRISNRIIGMV